MSLCHHPNDSYLYFRCDSARAASFIKRILRRALVLTSNRLSETSVLSRLQVKGLNYGRPGYQRHQDYRGIGVNPEARSSLPRLASPGRTAKPHSTSRTSFAELRVMNGCPTRLSSFLPSCADPARH